MNSSSAKILAFYLIQIGIGTAPPNPPGSAPWGEWPTFYGKEPDDPDNVITVYNNEAAIKGRQMDTGLVVKYPGIGIRVRSTTNETGYLQAQTIETALSQLKLGVNITVPGDTTYQIQCFQLTQPAMYVGEEQRNKRKIYTIRGLITFPTLPE